MSTNPSGDVLSESYQNCIYFQMLIVSDQMCRPVLQKTIVSDSHTADLLVLQHVWLEVVLMSNEATHVAQSANFTGLLPKLLKPCIILLGPGKAPFTMNTYKNPTIPKFYSLVLALGFWQNQGVRFWHGGIATWYVDHTKPVHYKIAEDPFQSICLNLPPCGNCSGCFDMLTYWKELFSYTFSLASMLLLDHALWSS